MLQKYDMTESANVDIEEVAKFSDSAERWWDLDSDFRPLHDLNPVRISWINRIISLKGQRVADIGCGGGILSDSGLVSRIERSVRQPEGG